MAYSFMKPRSFLRSVFFILAGFVATSQAQGNQPPRMTRLSRVEGGVFISHADGSNREQARAGHPLRQGDTISTVENGLAEVAVANVATATLENNSTLRLNRLMLSNGGSITRMTAKGGVVTFQVRLSRGDMFRISMSTFDVSVPDTSEFRVHTLSDGAWVHILQGHIRVSTKVGSTTLRKGQQIAIHLRDFQHRQVVQWLYPDRFDQLLRQENEAIHSIVRRASSVPTSRSLPNSPNLTDLSGYYLWLAYPGLSFTWPGNPTTRGVPPNVNGTWNLDPRFGWIWQTNPNPSVGLVPPNVGTWQLNPVLGWILTPNRTAAH